MAVASEALKNGDRDLPGQASEGIGSGDSDDGTKASEARALGILDLELNLNYPYIMSTGFE
jgi:hypothetical protein